MAFTITTKGKNLFGACNVDYAVGSAVDANYTGQPTVTADKIVFNLPGLLYVSNLAECYRKTLTLEPNVTYTFSFTVQESNASAFIRIYSVWGNYYAYYEGSRGLLYLHRLHLQSMCSY